MDGGSAMIDHVSIGIRDIENARKFYDAALKPLGYTCLSSSDAMLGYGKDSVAFWLLASPSPVPANADSGLHFCFAAPTRKSVDAFHKAALAGGGRDNGKPNLRADFSPSYYAAFVIDPDGYRIEAYCGEPA
jgi:catechol 2,3-dioxygenase-like lactoylglutathione lyase family enzyme